jgi:hypothetical protein
MYIAVVNLGCKLNLGRSEWILFWKLNVEGKGSSFIRSIGRTLYFGRPNMQVLFGIHRPQ